MRQMHSPQKYSHTLTLTHTHSHPHPFNILPHRVPEHAELVFRALVHVITPVVTNKKFSNFRPVLDAYIQHHFAGATAFRPLLTSLCEVVEKGALFYLWE